MKLIQKSCIFAVACTFAVPVTAAGSGKFCRDVVKSGEASGKTEEEAKAAATSWWSSRAGSLGKGYELWDHAKDKSLNCHPGPFGADFKCTASAKPCLPEGLLPDNPHKLDL
ncbi:hypothetical protein [Hyphomicrobium sp. ghe19]|uniref:hypothetical protein n=1 Tax=Hyphomicrobium sp. ghe19 TaxID=2682968 RepID=UPI001367924E|nr:hypothetical protein HYPP_00670 [Hyphomicrobium sp. ghe19]